MSERDLRHIKRLYGIGGLSYGNLSARKDATHFWMSASGVDKSKLDEPGRDILLVSGYDADNLKIILSVPPGVEPRRVSVDAIEHWKIYMEHPDVDAILHVHAWLEGIPATEVKLPVAPRSWRTTSRSCSPRSPTRPTPSSACATAASPPPARAWRRSSTGSLRICCRQVPMT